MRRHQGRQNRRGGDSRPSKIPSVALHFRGSTISGKSGQFFYFIFLGRRFTKPGINAPWKSSEATNLVTFPDIFAHLEGHLTLAEGEYGMGDHVCFAPSSQNVFRHHRKASNGMTPGGNSTDEEDVEKRLTKA